MRPDCRSGVWSVICSCIKGLIGIRIVSEIRSNLPESGAIKIWRSNTEQRQQGDSERALPDDQDIKGPLVGPVSVCEEHFGGVSGSAGRSNGSTFARKGFGSSLLYQCIV